MTKKIFTQRSLKDPLELPCGQVLPNRIAKAAMTEGLADENNRATAAHARLYSQWAEAGMGLSLTGNVMVDRNHLERPGNVAIVNRDLYPELTAWATSAKPAQGHCWMQIGHAGRQTPKYVNPLPKGPSRSHLQLLGQFGESEAYSHAEIVALIDQFANAAWVAKASGFTGVQIHAAHGFLLSQFLSPLVNTRSDQWGGSLANRARILLSVIEAVRAQVGPQFPVAVKLNSADFQVGGFSLEDCIQVVKWLNDIGVDLLEVTGGSYEKPQMIGYERVSGDNRYSPEQNVAVAKTLKREAYFLEYAKVIREVAKMPLMVTGGFRTRTAMENALSSGAIDVIGLARPFVVDPLIARSLLNGDIECVPKVEEQLAKKPYLIGPRSPLFLCRLINIQGQQGWFYHQLRRLGRGDAPDLSMGVLSGLVSYLFNERKAAHYLEKSVKD